MCCCFFIVVVVGGDQNLCQMAIHVISSNSGNPFTKCPHMPWTQCKLLHFSLSHSTICIENNSQATTIRMDIKKAQTIGHRIETKGNGDRSDRWKFNVEWQKTTTLSGGKKRARKIPKEWTKAMRRTKNQISRGEERRKKNDSQQSENCTRLQTMSVLVPELHTCIIEMKPRNLYVLRPKSMKW